ncbi:hypothetical protein PHYBOEH_001836 [Phytophthora boehmeriae]|uniref:Protein kinase domain-containing protein n=1 Tax=Phytophthora boehmeriae TaxID=109152 RepID=A0A8T1WYZ9_9STRA|nr:hypothetical protein PHYBOEH_001836 [Phytophthora boehmeriae]
MRRWLVGGLAGAIGSLAHADNSPATSFSFSQAGSSTNLRGGLKTPTEVLQLAISTGSGVQMSSASGGSNASATGDSDEDKTLALWLSISIPLVLLLAFAVAMFFCCRKERQMEGEPDLETGAGSFNVYQIHRRPQKTGNEAVARLTQEDEDALASWRIDAENIAPIRPLGAGAYGTVWLATYLDVSLSNGEPLSENRILELLQSGALHPSLSDRCPRGVAQLMFECLTLEPTLRPTSAQVADRLRSMLERERRVSDIGDDVSFSSMSGPNSFLGVREDGSSAYSGSVTSSRLSFERAFHYALLEEE